MTDSQVCSRCKGDGEVTVEISDGGFLHDVQETCPDCGGSGTAKIAVELQRFEEEVYARFIRIKVGDKSALVFYEDESDLAWAFQLVGVDQCGSLSPETQTRCQLSMGHDLAHHGDRESKYLSSSWA